ncbi:MAG: hypothetical protein CVU44_21070 [Chloroflexi bacterium HGW-Chloroflexi-6]|nr:MAG: hypothetical protein CVU44_21070 [Chloroflexi bacterium HGW-Chloroflexi-6]
MTTIATLVVKLVGDVSEYSASLRESQELTGNFSDRAVNGLSAIGGTLVVGALAAGAAAVAGIGVATWTASETIDEAYDTIRIGTGKTGEALDGLQQSFNNVFSSIPTDANSAAVAVSELNIRLGLTDGMLETSSMKLLRMTDLLGGDIQVNAGLFARVMGDWAVPLEENDILLDKIFRASQLTGVGVDKLMTNVVQFGAPMRNMNFGLDESIALFAKWEKEGVNAELVMGSLRQAAGHFADQNIPLRQGLDDTFESIKNAASGSEALAIAMDVFGARAAGDMAAAIREGRFDIDDMVAALGNAEGAIMDTSAATADWPEMWNQFTNGLTVQLAPMGDVLRNIAGEAIGMFAAFVSRPETQAFIEQLSLKVQEFGGMVLEWMPQIATGLENGLGWLDQNKGVVVAALAMIGAAILAFAYTSVAAAIPAVIAFVTAMWPVLLVIGLVGAAAYLLYTAWTENWGGIQQEVLPIVENVKTALSSVWSWMSTVLWPFLVVLGGTIRDQIGGGLAWMSGIWTNNLLPAMLAVYEWISANLFPLFMALADFWAVVFNLALTVMAGLWQNVLLPALSQVSHWMKDKIWPIFQKFGGFVKETLSPALEGFGNFMSGALLKAFEAISEAISNVIELIGNMTEALKSVKLPNWLTGGGGASASETSTAPGASAPAGLPASNPSPASQHAPAGPQLRGDKTSPAEAERIIIEIQGNSVLDLEALAYRVAEIIQMRGSTA